MDDEFDQIVAVTWPGHGAPDDGSGFSDASEEDVRRPYARNLESLATDYPTLAGRLPTADDYAARDISGKLAAWRALKAAQQTVLRLAHWQEAGR